MNRSKIDLLINDALSNRIFPGIEILVARSNHILFHEAYGYTSINSNKKKLGLNFLFDLASLTKPLATTCALLHLSAAKKLDLNDSIQQYLPEFNDPAAASITLIHLMTHSSGLPDWAALYEPDWDRKQGWRKLMKTQLINKPGTTMVYSCLGYILLAEIVRRVSNNTLNEYCHNHLFSPLGLRFMTFNPLRTKPTIEIVPTGFCQYRNQELRGIVHDENAGLFDGEGGNSGLFGTAEEIFQFCRSLISSAKSNNVGILPKEFLQLMFRNHNPSPLIPRALGWDIKLGSADYWSCGDRMPNGAVGHLGFTGTSLWMDLQSEIIILLLSNRVQISRDKNIPQMRQFRTLIHSRLMSDLLT